MPAIASNTVSTAANEADAWLRAVREQLVWTSERAAYLALRSTLHGLRDSMAVAQISEFGSRLPEWVRGIYYEGWRPSTDLARISSAADLLARVDQGCRAVLGPGADRITRAVFAVLVERLGQAGAEALKRALPSEIRTLWLRLEEDRLMEIAQQAH
jgi:uncharacterized protein (DUF2267 family)